MLEYILGIRINLLLKKSCIGSLETDKAKRLVIRMTSLCNIDEASKIMINMPTV